MFWVFKHRFSGTCHTPCQVFWVLASLKFTFLCKRNSNPMIANTTTNVFETSMSDSEEVLFVINEAYYATSVIVSLIFLLSFWPCLDLLNKLWIHPKNKKEVFNKNDRKHKTTKIFTQMLNISVTIAMIGFWLTALDHLIFNLIVYIPNLNITADICLIHLYGDSVPYYLAKLATYVYFVLRAWHTFYFTTMPYKIQLIVAILVVLLIAHILMCFFWMYILYDDMGVEKTDINSIICTFQSSAETVRLSKIDLLCAACVDVLFAIFTVYMLVGKLFKFVHNSVRVRGKNKLQFIEVMIEKHIEIEYSKTKHMEHFAKAILQDRASLSADVTATTTTAPTDIEITIPNTTTFAGQENINSNSGSPGEACAPKAQSSDFSNFQSSSHTSFNTIRTQLSNLDPKISCQVATEFVVGDAEVESPTSGKHADKHVVVRKQIIKISSSPTSDQETQNGDDQISIKYGDNDNDEQESDQSAQSDSETGGRTKAMSTNAHKKRSGNSQIGAIMKSSDTLRFKMSTIRHININMGDEEINDDMRLARIRENSGSTRMNHYQNNSSMDLSMYRSDSQNETSHSNSLAKETQTVGSHSLTSLSSVINSENEKEKDKGKDETKEKTQRRTSRLGRSRSRSRRRKKKIIKKNVQEIKGLNSSNMNDVLFFHRITNVENTVLFLSSKLLILMTIACFSSFLVYFLFFEGGFENAYTLDYLLNMICIWLSFENTSSIFWNIFCGKYCIKCFFPYIKMYALTCCNQCYKHKTYIIDDTQIKDDKCFLFGCCHLRTLKERKRVLELSKKEYSLIIKKNQHKKHSHSKKINKTNGK